ncbi:MAG: nucleotidyl transferase AbiEii/AbiGii toxin family protein [Polyangiaceae bacterium]|nr:nucleotidyl transferase AbiEii/AbiGii toxin family protein [Polyangiaceae bacterium]
MGTAPPNKLCAILGRAEIKDVVDLKVLLEHGLTDPATLAWVLSQIKIAPGALLPGNVDPIELERFRASTVDELRQLAYLRTRR